MKTLQDLFFNELADIYDAEHRIAKALPKMAKAATSAPLKKAFEVSPEKNHSEPPTKQPPEGTRDFVRRTAGGAKETAKIADAPAKGVTGGAEEVAGDVTDGAKHAVRRATGTAKSMYQTAPVKTGDAPATFMGYGRRNPVPFVLGEINFGAAIGYLLMVARR